SARGPSVRGAGQGDPGGQHARAPDASLLLHPGPRGRALRHDGRSDLPVPRQGVRSGAVREGSAEPAARGESSKEVEATEAIEAQNTSPITPEGLWGCYSFAADRVRG